MAGKRSFSRRCEVARSLLAVALAVGAFLATSRRSEAALTYSLSPSSQSIGPGSTNVFFDVNLDRTASAPSTGFKTFQVKFDFDGLAPFVTNLRVQDFGTVARPFLFSPLLHTPTGTTAGSLAGTSLTYTYTSTLPLGEGKGDGNFSLGRILFDVSNTLPIPSAFTVGIVPSGTTIQEVSFPSGAPTSLAASPGSPITAIVATPEPSSLALLALCGVGGLGWRWRKRRAKTAQA